jgi:hypothetical protein
MSVNLPQVKYDLMSLGGGLDQVTPTLSLNPGVARRCTNFECSVNGGYTRIQGYERFDGRLNPSDATYSILNVQLTQPLAVGDVITGQSSGATATVLLIIDNENVAITNEVGLFIFGESILENAIVVGTIVEIVGIDADGLTDAQYKHLAANVRRSAITEVPGDGSVLGVVFYNGIVYAWRNDATNVKAELYKSSSSGWTLVPLGIELKFDQGEKLIVDGNTVVGQTSAATGIVKRVVLESGSFANGNATGRLIFSTVSGTFQNGEQIRVTNQKYARALGAQTNITMLPDGRFEMVVGNFGGGANNSKVYGCDGKNRAFEFDGEIFVPIQTGMIVDKPQHVVVHAQHLFLSFGSSLQFSSIAKPYQWVPLLGAGELVVNDQITNLLILPGDQSSGALGVYTRKDTNVLYGTSSQNFQLVNLNSGTGALAYTAQTMDSAYVLDDRGVLSMSAAQNFGNFDTSSLTLNIRPYVQLRRNLATASLVNREKAQYRVFFSDGAALYITIVNGKMLGSMPMQMPNAVTCAFEGETLDGFSTAFFGSTNGFVYRLDAGTSFDGADIPANVTLVFNALSSPRIRKRYRKASMELTGDSYAEIQVAYNLGYRSIEIGQDVVKSYNSDLRNTYWDDMQWDNFVFDGQEISPSEIEVEGTAENIAFNISSVSKIFEPFTVNSIMLHYTLRRGIR